jgi:hypothetical protein
MVDFAGSQGKLTYDDKIVIFAKGQGLELVDFPETTLTWTRSCSRR